MTDFSKSFADKFMGRMFRKADGVVWDLSSGKLGIRTNEGIATLAGEGEEAQVVVNMFDQFGIEVPAFAQSTEVRRSAPRSDRPSRNPPRRRLRRQRTQ